MTTETRNCANCAAPLELPLGEVEALCEYCGAHLRFLPEEGELEVVRTREEMKYRERVAVQKAILQKKLEQEERERWRRTAGQVAIAALPLIGQSAGRAFFRATLERKGGCLGCGCLGFLLALAGLAAAALCLLAGL
ncbi:MAG: hypothetical protein P1V51_11885 [Deltaproteobacteria bacterium]|nr:hypothetical protein [Deltaproteobacteria bacterium]